MSINTHVRLVESTSERTRNTGEWPTRDSESAYMMRYSCTRGSRVRLSLACKQRTAWQIHLFIHSFIHLFIYSFIRGSSVQWNGQSDAMFDIRGKRMSKGQASLSRRRAFQVFGMSLCKHRLRVRPRASFIQVILARAIKRNDKMKIFCLFRVHSILCLL